jgi:hypothetical protein
VATFPYTGYLDGVGYAAVPTGTTTVTVNSSASLSSALTNATAGQRILLASATYSGSFTLSGKNGTATAGITIEAATPGTAIFAAGSTIVVNNSSYVTLKGLTFPYELTSGGNILGFRGNSNRCRVTRNTFGPATRASSAGTTKSTFVYMGDDTEHIRVDHNEIRNKTTPGNAVLGDGNFTTFQVVRHMRWDHNNVRGIGPEVSNEKEPFRLGVSSMSKSMSYSAIERNSFTDCIAEPEIVSVKAGGVRVSGNTVLRCIGGLVYRHGTNGVMADNYIVDRAATFGTTIGSGGFRVYDANHEISYNYVDGVVGGNFQGPLLLDTGDAEGSSTNLSAHWRVVNALVERNVLVGNPEGIRIGDNYDSAPTGCTIRDNIVASATTGVAITQRIAPVATTIGTNPYYATPATGGMAQSSDTIWRKAGYGPRLTYLQQADVGPNGDVNDTDGTGTLVSGTGGSGGGGTTEDGTAATKFGWGAPLGASDEFEYAGAPSSAKWGMYDGPGHDGNGRRVPARATVANGRLIGTGLANGDSFGMSHRFYQQFGRWEVRMRCFETGTVVAGNRYHVVLIIWPQSGEWPEDGEYDFVELSIPGQADLEAFMHFPHDADQAVQQRFFSKTGVDTSQFHNYALEWTPDELVGYVDGVEWFRTSGGASSIRKNIQDMPSGGLTIQLDNFDGTDQTPATMEVEWARVYSLTPVGPIASPQTVSAAGIPSAEAFGVPFITGANPAPPSGTVPTQLGVNTVLGSSTLGYTTVGTTPVPPGNQQVTAVGIPTGQAFGQPVVTVADGPPMVAAVGIPSAAVFGIPQASSGAAPAPAPGGTLVPALYAVAADGHTLIPLPAWTSIKISPVRNSSGSLEVSYPAGTPGFQHLHDHVSASPLRALEVRVWLGGSQEGALGGWLVQKSGDDLEPGSEWRFSGHFHEWLLTKALVYPQPISEANKNGELRFAGATAGLILATLMDQAQARGALPLVTRSFTTANDSSGVPWSKAISSMKLSPATTTVAQVADKLVELGMCEFELSPGRVWHAYNPGGQGVDRTVVAGQSPLTFAHAVNLAEHGRRESSRDAGTAVLVAGAEGFYESASSATAQAQLGWRAEVGISAGQLNSRSALLAVAPQYLQTASAGVAEYAAAVEFGPGAPIPLIDYGVGDWAFTVAGTGPDGPSRRRLRLAQLELEFARDRPAVGKAVFNDLITDKLTQLYRRLNAISTGDAVVGTSESTPGGSGEDTIPPAAPTGVTVASTEAYQQPGESETYALVIVGWAPVTTNAYADAETADKVRAAGLIADRLHAGLEILEDWTWSGVPAVVALYNDPLLQEAQAAGLSGDNWMFGAEALAWLDDYAVTHGGGGAITDDVAHYRVQWRYTGSQVVPSRQDPGNGVPGEPTPPRDPDAFPEDAAWFEPGESPTTTNRIEFGAVLAGRAIQVRVCAVDRAGNQGPWSSIVGVVTAIDNQPPPAPSKPIATAWFRTMDITWDGKGSSGEDMFAAAPDVSRGGGIEVHVDTGIDFTPDRPIGPGGTVDLATSRTYKATLYSAGTWNVVDLEIGTTYYARFVAVDRTGNASEPSETSDGVLPERLVNIDIGPDAISRVQIIDGEIVRAKIADLAVNDAKIESLDVGKIRTGTLTAQVTVSGRIQTPLVNGNQIQIDNGGIRMYRGGTVVGRWEVFDGSILITGQFNSAVTGQRIVINPGGGNPDTIRVYPTFSDVHSSIDSVDFQGGTIAGIRIVGSGTTTTANRGMVVVRDQYASMVHGRTDLSYWGSEIWVEQNFTRNKSATVDLIVDERLQSLSGPRRVAMIHYNSAGQPINSTGLYYQKTSFNGGEPHFYANGMDVGFVFAPGLIYVRNNPNGDFRDLTCRTLNQASGAVYKRGIRDLGAPAGAARSLTRTGGRLVESDEVDDPIELLRRSRPRRYRWHDDTDEVPERAGFIAEEMPYPIRVTDVHASTDGDQPDNVIESIDYSALTAVLTAAVKQLDARVDALESQSPESTRNPPRGTQ